jgi:hypothetical protein
MRIAPIPDLSIMAGAHGAVVALEQSRPLTLSGSLLERNDVPVRPNDDGAVR